MQNMFLHPGVGVLLRQVTSDSDNTVSEDTTINTGSRTEWVGANDCKELCFAFKFLAEATGDVVVERTYDPTAGANYDVHETVTITAEWFRSWAAGETLLGFYRVYNNSGQSMNIYVNKRIG